MAFRRLEMSSRHLLSYIVQARCARPPSLAPSRHWLRTFGRCILLTMAWLEGFRAEASPHQAYAVVESEVLRVRPAARSAG
eukprot:3934162-Pyramimonas_sp.AAC.1